MNRIEIVLSKRFYEPGDALYGAIFFRQVHPSSIDLITAQVQCTLKCAYQGRVVNKSTIISSTDIFHFKDSYPIGYWAFPFEMKLPISINNSSYFCSLSCPGNFFICEYTVAALALSDSGVVLSSEFPLFIYSRRNSGNTQEIFTEILRSNKHSPEVYVTHHFPESSILKGDAAIAIQKKLKPGFSLKITQKGTLYQLGDTVSITVSPTLSDQHQIDSVSYRLLRHVEIDPGLCGAAAIGTDTSKFTDVLFGVIRPAFTDNSESDQVELSLPPASYGDCIWTTNEAVISCRYEVEVSIASSLGPNLLPSSRANNECPPIIFNIPLTVVPPGSISEPSLPDWTSLCLVALTKDECDGIPRFAIKDRHELPPIPCQTAMVCGGKRGLASVSPQKVRENSEFRKIPVLRHLGATHF